ncbi:hypothetical protein ABZV67_08950 [Streptomyces sp. NPDC005065]|uniref:hypothetical protein n=1 Tax=Streptomyces sp. NPDC005065 TaxID=3154461 RepID=UPI0033AB4797
MLAGVRPGLDTSEAKIVIIAVLTMIDNAARASPAPQRGAVAGLIRGAATAVRRGRRPPPLKSRFMTDR